ncbi:NAC domain-containing protein 3 [Hirschfeldia incana]|nr:NAC domain-containing protein 3 [Hirschfeldia incana]
MVDPVGYRFHPTDEEIVGDYVRPKNLESNTSHVDEVMNTVDIYEFDPWELPYKSRISSTDEVWYFFGCKKNQNQLHIQSNRGERQSRKTKSGFWNKTGVTTDIIRKRGDREKIGEKRVFVFSRKIPGGGSKTRSKSKSDWVMHEYVATFLSPTDQGDLRVLSSSAAAGEIEHDLSLIPRVNNSSGGLSTETDMESPSFELQNPRHFTGFRHLEEEAQFEDEMHRVINNLPTEDWNSLFNNDDAGEEEEQGNIMLMQEDRNDYRPKKSLTGVYIGHSDDDRDSDSISSTTTTTTGSITTSSTCVSFGGSNHPIHLTDSSTIGAGSVTQEVSEALGTNTVTSEKKMNPCDDDAQISEIGGGKMGQEMVIKNKRAGFIYMVMQKITKKIKPCSCISGT